MQLNSPLAAPSRLFGDRFRRHNRYRHITMLWIWPKGDQTSDTSLISAPHPIVDGAILAGNDRAAFSETKRSIEATTSKQNYLAG
jgi:hypothetical protein